MSIMRLFLIAIIFALAACKSTETQINNEPSTKGDTSEAGGVEPSKIIVPMAVNLDVGEAAHILNDNHTNPESWLKVWQTDSIPFNPSDQYSFNFSVETEFVDRHQLKHSLAVYFRHVEREKFSLHNYWQVITYIDDRIQIPFIDGNELVKTIDSNAALLQFDEYGKLVSLIAARQTNESKSIQYRISENADIPEETVLLDFSDSTQYGVSSEYYPDSARGYPRMPPSATNNIALNLNLDASVETILTFTEFSEIDPVTFNHVTATTVYDSLGESHVIQLYFRKLQIESYENLWAIFTLLDGNVVNTKNRLQFLLQKYIPSENSPIVVSFNTDGTAATILNHDTESRILAKLEPYDPANGALPLDIKLDLSDITLYGSRFVVNSIEVNGHTVLYNEPIIEKYF